VAAVELPQERGLPSPVRLLLAAAVIDLFLEGWLRTINGSFPSQTLNLVVGAARSATDFVLAAAIVAGAARGLGSRPWLFAAATLFVIHGLLETGLRAWFAWWAAQNNFNLTDPVQSLLRAEALATTAAAAAAPLLVAIGIWIARSRPVGAEGLRAAAVVVIALTGAAAVAGYLSVAALEVSGLPAVEWTGIANVWLTAGWGISLSLLGIAALLAMPLGGSTATALIAGGIGVALAASGWVQWVMSRGGLQELPARYFDLILNVPTGVVALSLLVAAAGLAMGRDRGVTSKTATYDP
jgi:hypothetical protein